MGFISFIFIFILVVVLAIAMRVVVAFLQLRHKVKRAFGGGSRSNEPEDDDEPQRQKVYDKDVGEYVKFEEIRDDGSADETVHEEVQYREESQISDVEFEEIRD